MKKYTAKELMKPRYKVIADYPYSPYKINAVTDDKRCKKYPNIFRRVEFCYELEPKLLPIHFTLDFGIEKFEYKTRVKDENGNDLFGFSDFFIQLHEEFLGVKKYHFIKLYDNFKFKIIIHN